MSNDFDDKEGGKTVFNPKSGRHRQERGGDDLKVSGFFEKSDEPETLIQKEFTPVNLEYSEPTAIVGQPSVGVKILNGLEIQRPDGVFYIVVTVDGPRKAYLAPVDSLERNFKKVQQIDVSKLAQVYDWQAEIDAMLPDLNTIRENILESFWRAGAVDRSDLDRTAVTDKMFTNAFPYRVTKE